MNPPADLSHNRPRVAVIFTGGTISMRRLQGGIRPALVGDDICQSIAGLAERFEVLAVDFGQFPGPHMTLARMAELAARVRECLAQGVVGVVIAHGTDTLEESAYFLDLQDFGTRPIALVGAMRTMDELSWDGPINLWSACLAVASPQALGRGVLVVMNSTINAASEVTKSFTEALDTFISPDLGPLGIIEGERVIFYRAPARRMTIGSAMCADVELIEATAGASGRLVDAAVDAGARGLVIAAMGRGNVPPSMAEAIQRALGKGVPVVVCSRCWGGRVAPLYGYAGGGARLFEDGAIFAPWLNGQKARIALSLALGAGYDQKRLREFFDPETNSRT